jgi:hypothetical protein
MATANQNANFVITAKNAASSVFRTIGKDMGGLRSAAGKLTGVLAGLGISVGAIAYAFRNVLGNAIRGAIEEENQLRVLTGLLETRFPKAFEKFTAVMNDQVEVLKELAFADDEVRASFEIATRFTSKAAEATKIQAAAADLARAKGISLADATMLIGKAMKGQTKGLKDLGINLKKGAKLTDILAAIQGKYGTAAEDFADTTQGKFLRAQNNFNEALDTLGTALLPGITTLMEGLEPIIADFAGLIERKGPEIQKFFQEFSTKLKDEWIPKAKEAFLEIKETFDEVLQKAEDVFGENGKIALLLAGLGGIITGKLSGAIAGFLTGLGVDPFVSLIVGLLANAAVLAAMTIAGNVIAAAITARMGLTPGGPGGTPPIIPVGTPGGGIGGFFLKLLAGTGMALQFAQIPEKAASYFDNIAAIFGDAEAQARVDAKTLKLKQMSFFGLIIDALGLDLLGITDPFATPTPSTLPSYLAGYNGGVPANAPVYVNVTLDGDKITDKVTVRMGNRFTTDPGARVVK